MIRLLSAFLLCAVLIISLGSKPKKSKDYTHSSRKEFCDALNGKWKSVKSGGTLYFIIPFNAAKDSGFVDVNTTVDPLDATMLQFALDSAQSQFDSLTIWNLVFRSSEGALYMAMIMKLNKDTLQIFDNKQ